jgi:hypothetical protein
MQWVDGMVQLVSSDELANDVTGAEALLVNKPFKPFVSFEHLKDDFWEQICIKASSCCYLNYLNYLNYLTLIS